MGIEKSAFRTARPCPFCVSTHSFVMKKIKAPRQPEIPGAMIQAANTCATPSHPQLTCLIPTDAVAAPTIPPTMLCVVDTGSPHRVAAVRKTDEPIMAHIMASISTLGSLSYSCGSTILVRMVSATREPTKTEPLNSVMEAMTIACFIVRQRDETEVANELATSLAPGMRELVELFGP